MVALATNTNETPAWDVHDAFPKLHSRAREAKTTACADVPMLKSRNCIEIWLTIYETCDRLESFTRDPIGYMGSYLNLYEYTHSMPIVAVDPFGLKCSITVVMGHSAEVDDHLYDNKKKYSACDRFAPICCFMDRAVKKCVEINGDDSVIPGWPRPDTGPGDRLLYCKDIPKVLLDLDEPLKNGAKAICENNTCDCKRITITRKCSPSMKKCTRRLIETGEIARDPCGAGDAYDCKTGHVLRILD